MKNLKKYLSCLLAVCLLLGTLALVSCTITQNDNGDTTTTTAKPNDNTPTTPPDHQTPDSTSKNEYTVTVVDPNGNPIQGARVQFCKEMCLIPRPTGADGKMTQTLADGENIADYYVTVPAGANDAMGSTTVKYHFEAGKNELVITLDTYTVKAQKNGAALADVSFVVKSANAEVATAQTYDNGEVVFLLPVGTYTVTATSAEGTPAEGATQSFGADKTLTFTFGA